MPGTANIVDSSETIGKALKTLKSLREISIVVSVIVSIFSIFLMFNIIELAAATRKDEMKIMKLIGAYPSTIKLPFIAQNLFITFFSVILSSMALYIIYHYLIVRIFSSTAILYTMSLATLTQHILLFALGYMTAATVIAYFATNKYSKI
jgi:cell division protein FtsX